MPFFAPYHLVSKKSSWKGILFFKTVATIAGKYDAFGCLTSSDIIFHPFSINLPTIDEGPAPAPTRSSHSAPSALPVLCLVPLDSCKSQLPPPILFSLGVLPRRRTISTLPILVVSSPLFLPRASPLSTKYPNPPPCVSHDTNISGSFHCTMEDSLSNNFSSFVTTSSFILELIPIVLPILGINDRASPEWPKFLNDDISFSVGINTQPLSLTSICSPPPGSNA
mmetsp:Transcript_13151/g.19923  ORF Transcript_13151/g.19923 Transcript_13151/m.19923 type:complete len:224 (-) Transcript_13151:289-960(-)